MIVMPLSNEEFDADVLFDIITTGDAAKVGVVQCHGHGLL